MHNRLTVSIPGVTLAPQRVDVALYGEAVGYVEQRGEYWEATATWTVDRLSFEDEEYPSMGIAIAALVTNYQARPSYQARPKGTE